MPEGVAPYPRWDGPLKTGPMALTIAGGELKRTLNNIWGRAVLMFVLAYTIVGLGNLYTQTRGPGAATVHTIDAYLDFLMGNNVDFFLLKFLSPIWVSLYLAAIVGGPSLLEDARRGALELYLTRATTRVDYLIGKITATVGLTFATMAGPSVIYWGGAHFIVGKQPEGWSQALGGALLLALMMSAMVAGLGMGLSCVARSGRAASLVLFGTFAVMELVAGDLLEIITKDGRFQILSPFSALESQALSIFGLKNAYQFPTWWGLAEWIGLTVVGWALVAWRHPRVRGEERAGA